MRSETENHAEILKYAFRILELLSVETKVSTSEAASQRSDVSLAEDEDLVILMAMFLTAVREVGAPVLGVHLADAHISVDVAARYVQGLAAVRAANHGVLGHGATAGRHPVAAVSWQSGDAGFHQGLILFLDVFLAAVGDVALRKTTGQLAGHKFAVVVGAHHVDVVSSMHGAIRNVTTARWPPRVAQFDSLSVTRLDDRHVCCDK